MRYNRLLFSFIFIMILMTGCARSQSQLMVKEKETKTRLEFVDSGEEGRNSLNDPDFEGQEQAETKQAIDPTTIYVYVCGYVEKPGVYALSEDARICDALEMAGGVKVDGRGEALDQAQTICDGQTIYVPGMDEEKTQQAEHADNENDGMVNINTATIAELMTLPGIGETKANVIYSYRMENGNFSNIEELMQIPGIKEGVYNKIKNQIKV